MSMLLPRIFQPTRLLGGLRTRARPGCWVKMKAETSKAKPWIPARRLRHRRSCGRSSSVTSRPSPSRNSAMPASNPASPVAFPVSLVSPAGGRALAWAAGREECRAGEPLSAEVLPASALALGEATPASAIKPFRASSLNRLPRARDLNPLNATSRSMSASVSSSCSRILRATVRFMAQDLAAAIFAISTPVARYPLALAMTGSAGEITSTPGNASRILSR